MSMKQIVKVVVVVVVAYWIIVGVVLAVAPYVFEKVGGADLVSGR
jgi:hypothetical protein